MREKLPRKYDPAEDHKVAYVSYHTPGDEAGMGLRTSGLLTWLIQTLAKHSRVRQRRNRQVSE